jgi:L-alanine-DL-glutamate epimerase-like enolase superfamily enzyme
MKISDLRTAVITCRYAEPLRNTHHSWRSKQYVLVGVVADDGSTGMGEVYCDGESSPEVIEAILQREIAPRIIGENAYAIEHVRHKLGERAVLSGRRDANALVMAGIDIALWDLVGKCLGQPVFRLLGGYSNRVSVYGSGGMYGPHLTPQLLGEQMSAAVSKGFGGVKIKAAGASLAEDIQRVAAVREAIGPGARLMVDAMFVPDVPGAIRMASALEKYELHFLEAPTRAMDIRGWAKIQRSTRTPLAGPELESSIDVAREYVLADACHFLQFDVNLAGGISQGRDLAALARAFHRPITLHCAASAVGVAASAQLGASISNCDSLEFHLLHQGLHEALWKSGWALDDGALVIPDRPGLGLDIDFDSLAQRTSDA